MQRVSIPVCYFPSTVLFLDDNRDFLLNFVLQLDEGLAYRIFDNPGKALDYIHNKHHMLGVFNALHVRDEERAYAPGRLNAQLAPIQQEVYNPHRFTEISVVVLDYAMPSMNGLEFCRRIDNPNIKKILLTGQADEALAVEAFNEGLIHRYIKKSDFNAAELITNSIVELQFQYFQAMSDTIEQTLGFVSPHCLRDKRFVDFFTTFVRDNHIIEYYLLDDTGSFLMLDEDANVSFFILKHEKDMRAYYQLAVSEGVDEVLLEQLANGQKLPVSWSSTLKGDEWQKALVPAQPLKGSDLYYYAYLTGNTLFDIRQQKILSYLRYLDELDAEELLVD